ncbi:MAG: alpha/beta fold hydrolase [Deltaproteobacteria bacterium]|nr:alpha/beta fold hydrolase [Deltaproteobacteria bacterium]MBW2414489.1 alpha/beta fold hydrolase [Deltaproteobacteria bacterium]
MSWKEQAITIPAADGLVLEGVWQAGGGQRGAVVAPPHPEYAGSLDNPVVNEIAYGLYQSGVASVRFNWRGVGASQGSVSGDLDAADADYAAALEQIARTVEGPVIGAGYSFGAAAALRSALADRRVRGLLLVAPPVAMIESLDLSKFDHPLYVIVGADDAFAPADRLSELVAGTPRGQLEVILRADHFFVSGGLGELAGLVRGAQF